MLCFIFFPSSQESPELLPRPRLPAVPQHLGDGGGILVHRGSTCGSTGGLDAGLHVGDCQGQQPGAHVAGGLRGRAGAETGDLVVEALCRTEQGGDGQERKVKGFQLKGKECTVN